MPGKLMEYFNKQPRLGTLSTADKAGRVNVAYFGSPQMTDEKTVIIGIGKNRSFANLQENPNACFMIMEPGKTVPEWKGVRIYLKLTDCQTSGDKVDRIRDGIRKAAGDRAAKMIHAAVTFEVQEIRPFADFGQGWEKSI